MAGWVHGWVAVCFIHIVLGSFCWRKESRTDCSRRAAALASTIGPFLSTTGERAAASRAHFDKATRARRAGAAAGRGPEGCALFGPARDDIR
jgi:hypothetical protein